MGNILDKITSSFPDGRRICLDNRIMMMMMIIVIIIIIIIIIRAQGLWER